MSGHRLLTVRNCQRQHPINTRRLRKTVHTLLDKQLQIEDYDLGIYFVDSSEITRLNESYLRHKGPTDVIAFDYAEHGQPEALHGEVFICVDEALRQAPRFHVPWQTELVRYVVHGVLHLRGYDDHLPKDRRRMKDTEGRLVKELIARFGRSMGQIRNSKSEGRKKAEIRSPMPKRRKAS
jgi:probable rRNA maturation factor